MSQLPQKGYNIIWLAWMKDDYEKKIQYANKNNTWKLVNFVNRANVMIKKWCFKLKKD